MNSGDIPFVAVAIILSVLVTAVAFFALRAMKSGTVVLRLLSALAFPILLVAVIVYVNVWNPDPHGFVMVGLSVLAFLSLPFTILTSALLARRFDRS